MKYANPSTALAVCDCCGLRWYRSELKYQIIAARTTKELHCPDCLDLDNLQLLLGRVRDIQDPSPVYDPRPDNFLVERGEYAWPIVGGASMTMNMYPTTVFNPTGINNG